MRSQSSSVAVAVFVAIAMPLVSAADPPRVILHTTGGDISITLSEPASPLAVNAFLLNCVRGVYDETVFDSTDGGAVFGGANLQDGSPRESTGAIPAERELSVDSPPCRAAVAFRPGFANGAFNDHYAFLILTQDRLEHSHILNVFGYVESGLDIMDDAILTVDAEGNLQSPIEIVSVEVIR